MPKIHRASLHKTLYNAFIDEPDNTSCPYGTEDTYTEAVEIAEEAAENHPGVPIFIYECKPVAIAQTEKQVSTTRLR